MQCVCKPGRYNNSGTCAPCTESCAVCRNGDPTSCQQCNPGKVLEPLVVASDSADASPSAPLAANAGVRDNHRRQQVRHALQGRGHVSAQRCVHCRLSAEGCVLHQQGKWRLQHVFTGCLSDERRLLQIRVLPRKRRLQRTVEREVHTGEEGYGMSADGKLQSRGPACLRRRMLHQWQRMPALCCCGCKACGHTDFCQGTVAVTMCPATRRTAGAWLRPLGPC